MHNLAGDAKANEWVLEELQIADVDLSEGHEPGREVPATIQGRLRVGDYVVELRRAWVYWMARISPELPAELAAALDSTPCRHADRHYSGRSGILGDIVRADGFAGGMRPDGPVEGWHIDSQLGLTLFVRRLRELAK